MQRRNSALMAQRTENDTEQVGAHLIFIRRRRQIHHDFLAGAQQKATNRRKIEQDFFSVVSFAVLNVAKVSSKRNDSLRNRGAANHDLTARLRSIPTDFKPRKR